MFVTRNLPNIRCTEAVDKVITEAPPDATVTVLSDKTGYLFKKTEKKSAHVYRIITARINKTSEVISFVTNILDEDAYTIAAWYRLRWEIELFFKFIKQYLNVKHLVSRDLNGIKVMIYMTMILAILLIAYKKTNKLNGFKIPKLRFELEIDTEIMREIVVMCGGNPELAPHIFKSD